MADGYHFSSTAFYMQSHDVFLTWIGCLQLWHAGKTHYFNNIPKHFCCLPHIRTGLGQNRCWHWMTAIKSVWPAYWTSHTHKEISLCLKINLQCSRMWKSERRMAQRMEKKGNNKELRKHTSFSWALSYNIWMFMSLWGSFEVVSLKQLCGVIIQEDDVLPKSVLYSRISLCRLSPPHGILAMRKVT